MALTRDFKATVKARAERDGAFREALLTEAVEQLIAGEVEVGKAVLRDYINATVGFEKLAKATGTPSKSLMRMFGPKGNPRANNLFAVIGKLQRRSPPCCRQRQKEAGSVGKLTPLLPQRLQNLHQFRVDEFIAADQIAGFQRVVVAFGA